MKTAKFETTTGALLALLNARPVSFVFCDLYTINLVGGGVLRYSTGDVDITYGGNVWSHRGPFFDNKTNRAVAHWKVGLDVDTWSVVVVPRPVDPMTGAANPDKIGSQPWIVAVAAGVLDAAVVQVDRAFLPAWPKPSATPITPTGVVNLFTGRVANCDFARSQVVLNLNSHLELLGILMPRNLFQALCRFTLFDQGCSLVAASFAVNITAAGGSTRVSLLANATPPSPSQNTFALGRVVGTSGANAGFARSVRQWAAGTPSTFTLMSPFPFPITAGDGFTAYPGCDKTVAACNAFNNIANFGGQPDIPAPEVAV